MSKTIWRLLEVGEVIEEEDEIYDGGKWRRAFLVGDKVLLGIFRRRETLPEPQRWIPVSERRPTRDDAGSRGEVLWLRANGSHGVMGFYLKQSRLTHWMPLPPAPTPEPSADDLAFEAAAAEVFKNYDFDLLDGAGREATICRAIFDAALAHARKQ